MRAGEDGRRSGEGLDPSDPTQVRIALRDALRPVHPGEVLVGTPERVTAATSTWVWFVELDGDIPAAWRGAQVLRVFQPSEAHVAAREAALGVYLAANSYPIASTRWRGELGGSHPALLQQRLPGRPAAEMLASVHLRRVVRRLGALQADLHTIDPGDVPVPHLGAQAYLDHDLARRRAALTAHDPDGTWDWLQRTADQFELPRDVQPVLCHGDFHPLNALVAGDGAIGIVDWTDACVADRHHDVGRSIAIFWFASLVAGSGLERAVLRTLREWLGRTHHHAYETRSGVRLDAHRLAWWQAVHLYRGWLQLRELAEGTVEDRGSTTTGGFPDDLPERLLRRCQVLRTASGH